MSAASILMGVGGGLLLLLLLSWIIWRIVGWLEPDFGQVLISLFVITVLAILSVAVGFALKYL